MADYNITLPSGKVVQLTGAPDGVTQDQMKTEIIRQGKASEADFAMPEPSLSDSAGQLATALKDKFVPDIRPLAQAPEQMPYGTSKGAIDAVNAMTKQHNLMEESFIGDEERQKLKAQEAERGFLSGVGQGVMNTLKNFQAGTALSPDFLPEGVQKILDYQPFGENLPRKERQIQVDEEMKKLNERYGITRYENPFSTMVGETAPFLATGVAGESLLSGIGGALRKPIKDLSIGTYRRFGNEAAAQRVINKPRAMRAEWMENMLATGRGGLTGAAEGAALHDKSAMEGTTDALLGGLSGWMGPARLLNKVRNERLPEGRALIDEMETAGFHITPGIRTNNRRLQKEESALRNSDYYGDEFHNSVDRVNQQRMTEMAGDAIGLDLKGVDMVSQEKLLNHKNSLSQEYQQLEQNTTGFMKEDELHKSAELLSDLRPTPHRNTSKKDRERYDTVRSIFNLFKNEIGSKEFNSKGQIIGYTFDGSDYQRIRQRIQDEKSQAYTAGDKRLGDKLTEMQKILDKSVTNGMDDKVADQWKDLNERYAMTNILMEDGMTPSGLVDARKITGKVMEKGEAERTLTGQGGRIKKFQDIARYNDVLNGRNVPGGDLHGLGSNEPDPDRGLIRRGAQIALKPYNALALAYRTNTLPVIGVGRRISPAHGISPITSIELQRAMGQTNTAENLLSDTYDNASESMKKYLRDLLKGE